MRGPSVSGHVQNRRGAAVGDTKVSSDTMRPVCFFPQDAAFQCPTRAKVGSGADRGPALTEEHH